MPAAPTSASAAPPVSSSAFSFPIVQAPFRIYYAYNLNRLHSEIVSPPDYINPSELKLLGDTLPPEVYKTQVLPLLQEFSLNPGRLNYFEPKTTFRFTVGKTF